MHNDRANSVLHNGTGWHYGVSYLPTTKGTCVQLIYRYAVPRRREDSKSTAEAEQTGQRYRPLVKGKCA